MQFTVVSGFSVNMPDWRDCEGQLLDGRYPLERYVGGDEGNALFLTGSASATVRIRRADAAHAPVLAARWNRAKLLRHRHLLKINEAGVSAMAGETVAYLVAEHAEENLAEILCARPLTTDESREMLLQVADALDYLHARGMAHSDLKASNILAIGDTVKISSESVVEGDAAADIRALGFTLIHALTQRVETFARDDPEPAADLPAPFDEIAKGCLNPDPALRWTANKIIARLRSPEDTGSSLPASPAMADKPTTMRMGLRRFAGPAGLVIAGLAVVAGVVMRRTDAPSPAPGDSRKPPAAVAPGPARAPTASGSKTVGPVRLAERAQSTSKRLVSEDGVTRRIVPNVPEKARSTIEGKPAVVVRISVDPKGNVTKAALERSFSPYFSNFALQAARQWKFTPYEGASPREWILRFEFTRTNTQVVAQRAVRE
ncbi:MAG TPA: TonB family protein [Bryobacteraceae bacterium]|nr:TonB family protein [Bryobacteraceae bacterium]